MLAQVLGGYRCNWIVPAFAWLVVAFMILPILVIFALFLAPMIVPGIVSALFGVAQRLRREG